VSEVRITYRPLPDATPETERAVLGRVYAFALEKHREKKAAEKGYKGGSRRDSISPR
jgi:hypothetical protein